MKRLALLILCTAFCVSAQAANAPVPAPKRVNKAIELLESGQAVYYFYGKGGYEEGKKITWRDGVVALWVLFKYRFTE